MTKKEAVQLLAILKAAYPNSYRGMSKEEAAGTISVWTMQFADLPADIVLMALNKLIGSSKFPPSIAEVKSKISSLHWEASDAIRLHRQLGKEAPKQLQRVYEITLDYRHQCHAEPTLMQMVEGSRLMLGAPENMED